MTEHFATSPFGGRMIDAAHFLSYENLRQQQKMRKKNTNNIPAQEPASQIDRWKLLRSLTEAREAYALSPRSIAVLEALLSFHTDKYLDADKPLIVFPSNHELSMRLRGMSAPTIRRHIAILVSLGFILRRDSPNGKRFVRRDANGEIAMAFGFDLSPLIFKADEIEQFASQKREENRHRQQIRFAITIHLRDIAKMIEAAFQEELQGDWPAMAQRLEALSGRVERNGTITDLSKRCELLSCLRRDVENLYFSNISQEELSGNAGENEHHIQNSEIESHFENKIAYQPDKNTHTLTKKQNIDISNAKPAINLNDILMKCPQIKDYAIYGIKSWSDFISTASHISLMLGVSHSAWERACTVMGETDAAITIATILERGHCIRNAGGYLRKLTQRAQAGQYSLKPVLNALSETRH